MAHQPSWHELALLIERRPKPPVRARVVRSTSAARDEAWVLHDGLDTWHIATGTRIEVTGAESTTIVDEGRFESIRGMGVASNLWAKMMIQGRLFGDLTTKPGAVVGQEVIDGNPCWVADVAGLRSGEEVTFRLWVHTETGIILRVERLDEIEAVVQLTDVTFGEVIEPQE
jgi:hypothetical protein